MKSFKKSSRGRSQGVPKIFRAHRAVIVVIVQLSSYLRSNFHLQLKITHLHRVVTLLVACSCRG